MAHWKLECGLCDGREQKLQEIRSKIQRLLIIFLEPSDKLTKTPEPQIFHIITRRQSSVVIHCQFHIELRVHSGRLRVQSEMLLPTPLR